jgi:uncharacterized protein (TIGR03790 family)
MVRFFGGLGTLAASSMLTAALLTAALLMAFPPAADALNASQLAVVVNTADPLSVQIGDYYAAQRNINFQNLIRVSFPPGETTMTRETFAEVKAQIDAQTMPRVQAYALTWAAPYRVECMSITAAVAFGYQPGLCATECKPTQPSPYYNSRSRLPFSQYGMRPTMAIAAASFEHAKALIDTGVRSDYTHPAGTAYLLSTSDKLRNVRAVSYAAAGRIVGRRIRLQILHQNALSNARDVLFYFTGTTSVADLQTLNFVPGAVADHLTSAGGQLTDSEQMSALRWLEAGATGSYGAVVEPCNMAQKFPNIPLLLAAYLSGETLIEAYWQSVAMPGQGIFIGEPLAAPFAERPLQ